MSTATFWAPGCKDQLDKIPGAVLCPEQRCAEAHEFLHAVCTCQPPFTNGCVNPTPNCCSFTPFTPVIVFNPDGTSCYCCCGCFATGTQVASSAEETRTVQEFTGGDPLWVAMDMGLTTWASIPVLFSSGTDAEAQNPMIRVSFGDPAAAEEIFVTWDQLFMVAGHRLKRAAKLVPAADRLIRADGSLAPVLDMSAGLHQRGVHQVATSESPTTDPSGHLLIANGVVCGDYSLQVTDLEGARPDLLVDGHAGLPEFGTKEYGERYAHLTGNTFQAHPPNRVVRESEPGVFEVFTADTAPEVPSDARSLVTRQQAEDIQAGARQDSILTYAGSPITNYLFKLFKGFYPTVVFYLDETADLPNVYAFRQQGTPTVLVNGGFIRTSIVGFEAIAFAIAQALSHLFGGPPESKEGYTCTGAADYGALLGVFPYVWYGHFAQPYIDQAIVQMERLFDAIGPAHRGGVPGDTCVRISIDCRKQAMHAASRTAPLPPCAGGPKAAPLAVTGPTGGTGDGGSYVTVTFNEAVDPVTSQFPGSYEFQPIAPASAAALSPGDPTEVTISAELRTGQQYTIRAAEVLSANGNPVIPSRSRATFSIGEG